VRRRGTILYLANLGTIPLHLWASRWALWRSPTGAILDLDPKDAPFAHVVQLARAIHQRVGRIQLPCFAKTSGGSGLHVLIPLAGQLTHAESRTLAQLFGQVMVREHPDLLHPDPRRRQRAGRVYLDCLQNGHGKTIAGLSAHAPSPVARVSMPLTLARGECRLDPAAFTIKTAPARMKRLREDSAGAGAATAPGPAEGAAIGWKGGRLAEVTQGFVEGRR